MRTAAKDYIIKTVYKTNTLPVISECNTSCIFCSHKQNPEYVETFRMPKMSLKDFEEITEFLSSERKIVIGESATRIVEGEPFLYKDILPLLTMVRNKFKKTTIQITTNGTLINEQIVRHLEDLGDIELNISLNCVDPSKREIVLGKQAAGNIKEKIQLLKGRIAFTGSCVIVPGLIEADEVQEVVKLLAENGAQTVRVFLPGYSKESGQNYKLHTLYDDAMDYICKLRDKYPLPVIVEPSIISDLQCRIEGVIKESPSSAAGIKQGDIITQVNGLKVVSRVDAFDRIYRLRNPRLTIVRKKEPGKTEELNIYLNKERNSSPGIVVLFDIAPETGERVEKTVSRHQAENVLVMTSELACGIVKEYLESCEYGFTCRVISVPNIFFGGTIMCAGLLTASDIINCASKYLVEHHKPDLIILPNVMFDFDKRDLLGVGIDEIERKLGIPVDTTN